MKKYELTDETMKVNGKVLHRIRAVRDIPRHGVRRGDIGGWVESEDNLNHVGDCWIGGDAIVMCDAVVMNDAIVCEDAFITDDAMVSDNAVVGGTVQMRNFSSVSGNALVQSRACLDGVNIEGHARFCRYAYIIGGIVRGNAVRYDGREVAERREIARLRAALKPVLDIVMDSATSDLSMELAIMECKRIYNEK